MCTDARTADVSVVTTELMDCSAGTADTTRAFKVDF